MPTSVRSLRLSETLGLDPGASTVRIGTVRRKQGKKHGSRGLINFDTASLGWYVVGALAWSGENLGKVRISTWEGSLPQELGRRTWRIERPEAYFDADNPRWPDTIELSLTLPPALERTYGGGALRDAVRVELERQERLARQEVKRRNTRSDHLTRVRPPHDHLTRVHDHLTRVGGLSCGRVVSPAKSGVAGGGASWRSVNPGEVVGKGWRVLRYRR